MSIFHSLWQRNIENGVRTSKLTAYSSYKYILNGSQIAAEMWDDCVNMYLYDEYGSPIGFLHRYKNMAEDTYKTYFYEKNMFGDILAVYDQNGVKQVSYSYDAFGKSTRTIHVANTRADNNNLRYRGYYYDFETGFYYLNSRYYDPVTCRFINADGYVSTGQGLIGYNMFVYCGNNPVNMYDPNGEFGILTTLAIIGVCAIVGSALGAFNAACTGGDPVEGAVEGFITGAVGAAAGLLFSSSVVAVCVSTIVSGIADVGVQYLFSDNKENWEWDYKRTFKVAIQSGIGTAIPTFGDNGLSNAFATTMIWCEASFLINVSDIVYQNFKISIGDDTHISNATGLIKKVSWCDA